MALGTYQKIDRVISGNPFGDGSDGVLSSATIPTMVNESCSGAAAGTALTCGSTGLTDGDIILIHQSRGTGVGQWEVNRVASGGGTVNIVTQKDLQYTYTDSGASQAQVTVIKQYADVTVQAGTWALPAWGGDQGGILTFACNGTLTVTGAIHGHGGNGLVTGSTDCIATKAGGTGGGFRGGMVHRGHGAGTCLDGGSEYSADGGQGEGYPKAGDTFSNAANGNGGGGSDVATGLGGGGGGGGNGTAGTNGTTRGGTGGATAGVAALTTMVFGGGGGSGQYNYSFPVGTGASGGGIVLIFAKDIAEITGTIYMKGGNGGSAAGGGGGGAGGSVLIQCETAILGTTKVTATAGSAGTDFGGIGGVGRIAVHHSGTVTGTTSPTFSDTTDSSLVETTASSGATGSFHFM